MRVNLSIIRNDLSSCLAVMPIFEIAVLWQLPIRLTTFRHLRSDCEGHLRLSCVSAARATSPTPIHTLLTNLGGGETELWICMAA